MAVGDRPLTNDNAEEFGNAMLYRHYGKVFETNDRGVIHDQFGYVAETVRGRLFLGLGAGVLLFGFGIVQGEPFIMGMGFLPLVIFGGWLLIRWKTATNARTKQLVILQWFKAKGIPFPYENASEVIDPIERMDWAEAHKHDALKQELAELADRNWGDAVIIARRSAELPIFGRMMIEKARWEKDLLKKQSILVKLLEDPAIFGLTREETLAVFPLLFFDWEGRPVITQGYYRAWAILRDGADWVPVSVAEVIDSGRQVSPKNFEAAFPQLPGVPYRV